VADPTPAGRWDGPGVDAWDPWSPQEIARRLDGLEAVWCVVGGWSIDLFLGEQTRPHHDLEIAIKREDLPKVRKHLSGFDFHAVRSGSVRRLAPDETSPLDFRQHWVLDAVAQSWRVDVMIEPGDEDWWVYRRDERVRAPRASMTGRTADGIPYLLPHGSLLYKAKSPGAKDQADFDAVLSSMSGAATVWLADALDLVHPGHPWRDQL
jgi:hypothetical protein